MRGFSGTTEPSKYFFNVATPELIHKSVGSLTGINDALGSIVCPFDWKKSKNICRTCALLNCFILLPSFFILNYKKTPSQPRTKTRCTTLVAMMFHHYLLNSITLSSVDISI